MDLPDGWSQLEGISSMGWDIWLGQRIKTQEFAIVSRRIDSGGWTIGKAHKTRHGGSLALKALRREFEAGGDQVEDLLEDKRLPEGWSTLNACNDGTREVCAAYRKVAVEAQGFDRWEYKIWHRDIRPNWPWVAGADALSENTARVAVALVRLKMKQGTYEPEDIYPYLSNANFGRF